MEPGLIYFPGNMFISRTAGNTGKYTISNNGLLVGPVSGGRAHMLQVDQIRY